MNESSRDDAAFAELFRATAAPLSDDGFTSRVLAALPPPARATFDVRFFAWSLAGAILGAVVAHGNGAMAGLREVAQQISQMLQRAPALLDPWIVFALVFTTVCAVFTTVAMRHRHLFV